MKKNTASLAFFILFESIFLVSCQEKPSDVSTAESLPPLFEGDIIPDYETIEYAYGEGMANTLFAKGIIPSNPPHNESDPIFPIRQQRGTAPNFPLWTEEYNLNEYYVIPIYVDTGYAQWARDLIVKSLKKLMRKSGVVRFRFLDNKPTNGRSFINIGQFGSSGCASYVGRKPSMATSRDGQKVWIGMSCMKEGIIQHEVLHAMGFWHEQSRPDRDQYVTVNYGNVIGGYQENFAKQTSINSLGAGYDYDSVMHYSPTHFSKNGGKTITANGNDYRIGQREGISAGDKLQVRLLYQCVDGPRTYSTFQAEKCTWDCKCGLKMRGCSGRDWVCKGSLICVENQCLKE